MRQKSRELGGSGEFPTNALGDPCFGLLFDPIYLEGDGYSKMCRAHERGCLNPLQSRRTVLDIAPRPSDSTLSPKLSGRPNCF